MKITLSSSNPFSAADLNWAYGYEYIKEGARVLDYGCFNGRFLRELRKHKAVEVQGVDKNTDILATFNDLPALHVDKTLPFPDETFDVVTIFEVLEHVYDQLALMKELRRVLKPGGLLILSVPRKHFFSFLDHGNFKYVFPRLHKFWYVRKHGVEKYEYRYLNNPNGLIGDVEKEKAWHQHFTDTEMTSLLTRAGFGLTDTDASGAFGLALGCFQLFLKIRVPQALWRWQAHKFAAEKMYCVAHKL